MSVAIKIKIKNLDQIQSLFKKAPAKMGKELNTAVSRVITKLESTAKKEAPVSKQSGGGNLRQSILSAMTGQARGVVRVGASYGIFVHEGTRPHLITVVRKKSLANRRTGQFFGKRVRHPGTKANPFLTRAVDKEQGFIDKEFSLAVARVLK